MQKQVRHDQDDGDDNLIIVFPSSKRHPDEYRDLWKDKIFLKMIHGFGRIPKQVRDDTLIVGFCCSKRHAGHTDEYRDQAASHRIEIQSTIFRFSNSVLCRQIPKQVRDDDIFIITVSPGVMPVIAMNIGIFRHLIAESAPFDTLRCSGSGAWA